MDKGSASWITSNPSLKSASFLLAGLRLLHPKKLPGDLPVPLECHPLTMNTIVLQLSDAVADISILQCSAKFRIKIINAHFVADNAHHALASSATARPTFNIEEDIVVIHTGWTAEKKKKKKTLLFLNKNSASGGVGIQVMVEICLKVLYVFAMPAEWVLSIVVPIFKWNVDIWNCCCY